MCKRLRRSVECPIRDALTWEQRWAGADAGLIWCWERGRQKQAEQPDLALRARNGELVTLAWKRGTLSYLAQWQGLRGEDLDIVLDSQAKIVCTKKGKTIAFKAGVPSDGETEEQLFAPSEHEDSADM